MIDNQFKIDYSKDIETKGVDNVYWNLIKLRKESNMTQLDMAQLIGVKEYQTYGNKELGKANFNIEEMMIIKKHFDKPLDYIFLTEQSIKN